MSNAQMHVQECNVRNKAHKVGAEGGVGGDEALHLGQQRHHARLRALARDHPADGDEVAIEHAAP